MRWQLARRAVRVSAFLLLGASGCERAHSEQVTAPGSSVTPLPLSKTKAEVGRPAPDFALSDLEGHNVRLADFRGKTVILEWFNPGCPYVNAAHTKGSLKGFADRVAEKGAVYF